MVLGFVEGLPVEGVHVNVPSTCQTFHVGCHLGRNMYDSSRHVEVRYFPNENSTIILFGIHFSPLFGLKPAFFSFLPHMPVEMLSFPWDFFST